MSELKTLLTSLGDNSLDKSMFPLINKWNEPTPTSLQVLEVLDHCIHGSLASGFVVAALQGFYDVALKQEGISHEANLPKATWRHPNGLQP